MCFYMKDLAFTLSAFAEFVVRGIDVGCLWHASPAIRSPVSSPVLDDGFCMRIYDASVYCSQADVVSSARSAIRKLL